jgi:hypothetical protein
MIELMINRREGGVTTLSITTLSRITFSIRTLSIIINETQHSA